MSKFKIETKVPLSRRMTGRASMFPFRSMKKGDSFFVPAQKQKYRQQVYLSAYYFSRRLKAKFATRTVKGGFRVWRIK